MLQEQQAAPAPASPAGQHGAAGNGKASAAEQAAIDKLRSDTAKGSVPEGGALEQANSLGEARLPAASAAAAPAGRRTSATSVEGSGDSASTSSPQGTLPASWRPPGPPHAAKPPRSRRGSRPQVAALEPLQEPAHGTDSSPASAPPPQHLEAQQVSDSAGSDNMRPLKKLFPAADHPSPPAALSAGAATRAAVEAASQSGAQAAGAAVAPPPELAHVLSLLSRLLSATAVLVDLQDPPVAYIR